MRRTQHRLTIAEQILLLFILPLLSPPTSLSPILWSIATAEGCTYQGSQLSNAALPASFCAHEFTDSLSKPRGLLVTDSGDILVVEANAARIVALTDDNGDLRSDTNERYTIASGGGINHGLALYASRIYASSDSTVYSWSYSSGQRTDSSSSQQTVITGMATGGHKTRTLVFDSQGRLYVSIGSAGNVDADSSRSRIRRFDVSSIPAGGVAFSTGELFADGLRNEVGLAFDKHAVLWGVENGADNLQRSDLGGDIHNDNPGEELNRFPESQAGSHWGYPYCWSEFKLGDAGQGYGTVWAWPSFMSDGTHTDAWCRQNTVSSVMSMQAHSAPLGITFFNASQVAQACEGAFPASMDGHAIIPFHGSWNRDTPTGYKVVTVPMSSDGNPSVEQPIDLLWHDGSGAKWPNNFRPVDARFDQCGRLLVSDDGAGYLTCPSPFLANQTH